MLRRVDPVDLLTRYLRGEYKNLMIPGQKVKITSGVRMGKVLGSDASAEIFKLSSKHNNGNVIVTTNHSNFKYFKDLSENKDTIKPNLRCLHCKRIVQNNSVGIPVEVDHSNNKLRFQVVGVYCHFGCAYADLKRTLGITRIYRDPLYSNSEQLLYALYYSMYPDKKGEKIKESPDWRLLDENCGPLTSEQFDSGTYSYIHVPSIITIPTKVQHIRLKINPR